MELGIQIAAGLRTIERDDGGLTVVPYRPMSEEEKTRARLHRAHRGSPETRRGASGTAQPVKRPGGENGATLRGLLSATDDDRVLVPALAEHEDA